jgi:hypothetical protein
MLPSKIALLLLDLIFAHSFIYYGTCIARYGGRPNDRHASVVPHYKANCDRSGILAPISRMPRLKNAVFD